MANAKVFYLRRLLLIFICLLFITFLSIDVYSIDFKISSNILKFLSVFLCLIISIISSPLSNQSKNIFLLQLGLIFTIMADYIFLIIKDDFSLAIGLFSIVQIVYSLRYREGNELNRILTFIIYYLLIVILYKTIVINLIKIDFLIAIGAFYGICLFFSIKEAIWIYKHDHNRVNNRMILFGMILFCLCDLNLGLNYLLDGVKSTGSILNLLKNITSISIWIYYLPSQILLTFSGIDMSSNYQ